MDERRTCCLSSAQMMDHPLIFTLFLTCQKQNFAITLLFWIVDPSLLLAVASGARGASGVQVVASGARLERHVFSTTSRCPSLRPSFEGQFSNWSFVFLSLSFMCHIYVMNFSEIRKVNLVRGRDARI
jgi:hypothetical protein